MKIKYAFLDGTVTEVEVSDEIGAVIIDSRKAEHAQDERHRYHCYSYDAIDYEGEEYGACDEYAVEDDSAEKAARIREAFSHLTATQQRRLRHNDPECPQSPSKFPKAPHDARNYTGQPRPVTSLIGTIPLCD